MSILQCSEPFQFIFDNSNDELIFCKLFRIIQFLREATLESKVAPTNRNRSVYLLHTSKTFSNVELFSIFCTNYFGINLRHQNKNNVVEKISCFVSEHLKYCSRINEYWFNKNACLNVVLDLSFPKPNLSLLP